MNNLFKKFRKSTIISVVGLIIVVSIVLLTAPAMALAGGGGFFGAVLSIAAVVAMAYVGMPGLFSFTSIAGNMCTVVSLSLPSVLGAAVGTTLAVGAVTGAFNGSGNSSGPVMVSNPKTGETTSCGTKNGQCCVTSNGYALGSCPAGYSCALSVGGSEDERYIPLSKIYYDINYTNEEGANVPVYRYLRTDEDGVESPGGIAGGELVCNLSNASLVGIDDKCSSLDGQTCSSPANSCGMKNTATYTCDGSCSVSNSPPADNQCKTPTVTLDKEKQMVPPKASCTIAWEATDATSCEVSGPTGVIGTGLSGSVQTPPLIDRSVNYNVMCKNGTVVTSSKVFMCQLVPIYKEN
jgi:hypothetical protein